jgi:hypothetical protein
VHERLLLVGGSTPQLITRSLTFAGRLRINPRKTRMAEPYDYREPPGWAQAVAESFEQRRLDDGAIIVLYGDCPRCRD